MRTLMLCLPPQIADTCWGECAGKAGLGQAEIPPDQFLTAPTQPELTGHAGRVRGFHPARAGLGSVGWVNIPAAAWNGKKQAKRKEKNLT